MRYDWAGSRISSPCLHRRISECVKIYCFVIDRSSKSRRVAKPGRRFSIHVGATSSMISGFCPWAVQIWLIINERRVEDKPRQREFIHLPCLLDITNQLMDEIWELWRISCLHGWKSAINFSNRSALGWAIGYGWDWLSSPCLHRRISEWVMIYCFIIDRSSKEQKGCQSWSQRFIHVGAISSIMSRLYPWIAQLWLIINERRVEDEPRQQ